MLVDTGLTDKGYFEVKSQDVGGKVTVVVTEEDDPMPQFNSDGVEIVERGGTNVAVVSPLKGDAPASDFDENPMANLVGDPNYNPDDDEGGDAGGKEGTGTEDDIDADLEDKDGGDEGTGAGKDGAEAGSGVIDADTEAAKNTLANTTGTKSISLLNAKGVAYIWS